MIRKGFAVLSIYAITLPAAAQEGQTVTYQGVLASLGGEPIQGARALTFRLHALAEGGPILWEERHPQVQVEAGSFVVELGIAQPFPDDLGSEALYLGLQVEADEEMRPRLAVGSALRARWAAVAEHARDVAGESIHPASVSIGERRVIDEQGRWVGDPTGLQGPQGEVGPAGPAGPAARGGTTLVLTGDGRELGVLLSYSTAYDGRDIRLMIAREGQVVSIGCPINGDDVQCGWMWAESVYYLQANCQGAPQSISNYVQAGRGDAAGSFHGGAFDRMVHGVLLKGSRRPILYIGEPSPVARMESYHRYSVDDSCQGPTGGPIAYPLVLGDALGPLPEINGPVQLAPAP